MMRYSTFPRTVAPAHFIEDVVSVFRAHEKEISTEKRAKGLTSDQVLNVVHDDLKDLGFDLESGKKSHQKIHRPVFYGENGAPTVRYEVDGYHPEWKCGLEIEAGRSWMGNAVYRDIVHALVMVDVDHLLLAVPNAYKYKSGGRNSVSKDFENTSNLADALFSHSRITFPYQLTVIGY
ncbi:MAG: hypothetical protein P1U58_18010 [Verrucomicrobiales bacterium]|nr:hypothetical protein [Verrucomicrobiales bacterium]